MLNQVTVVIPAHNRPERLRRLLDYYCRTDMPSYPYAASTPEIDLIKECIRKHLQQNPDKSKSR